jgi:micrococcal nuclease
VSRLAVLACVTVLSGRAETATTTVVATETVVETRTGPSATIGVETSPPPAPSARTVASITDGDTLRLDDGTRVRLVQIDTPELGSGECYSRKAAEELRRLAPVGSAVRLEADPVLDRTDRYGRALRYVFRGRTNVNLALVRRGAAAPWFYGGDRGRYADRLLAAAEEAKAAKRGLWGACPGTVLDPTRGIETRDKPAPAAAPVAGSAGGASCHPSYAGACLDPRASDYDCTGGSGNGPLYTGRVRVVGPDVFGLDPDGDGIGCEDS